MRWIVRATAPLAACLFLCMPVSAGLSDGPRWPGDFAYPLRIGAVWSLLAVFDFDTRRVYPAVIDIGINDGGTRPPGHACAIDYLPGPAVNVSCNDPFGDYDGLMNQIYAATNEGDSSYTDHGERMKNRIAETINDGGNTGIAGQVAVPNLYAFSEITGFLFELDTTIERAVADGATVINISAGLPCRMLWLGDFTGDVCTPAGRGAYCALDLTHGVVESLSPLVNTGINGVMDWLQAATPVMKAALCGASTAASLVEGDLRLRMNQAAAYARTQGVPIVASAGNVYNPVPLGDVTLELTPMAQNDVSSWRILPATANHVIAVGAIARENGMPNADFHGDRVDVWAPAFDTSPAAAFVSGVIATAQAVNPTLNPRSNLSGSQRAAIVGRLRTALQETAYDASHPALAPDPYRRNLINPYAFVRWAAADYVPPFESLGYAAQTDDLLTANSENYPDGHPFWTLDLDTPEQRRAGSIVYVPGSPAYRDSDTFTVRFPQRNGPFAATVDLYFLRDYGDLRLSADLPRGTRLKLLEATEAGPERRLRFELSEFAAGSAVALTVSGYKEDDDNLYKLQVTLDDRTPANVVKPRRAVEAQAGEIRRFVEQLELAFPRGGLPESGCVSCNTLEPRGRIEFDSARHRLAGRGLPGNARAVRFLEVSRKGSYSLQLDARGLEGVRGLTVQLLDSRGRVVATGKRGALDAALNPGRYLIVLAADVATRAPLSVGYRFGLQSASGRR